jgi:hypothetical protein
MKRSAIAALATVTALAGTLALARPAAVLAARNPAASAAVLRAPPPWFRGGLILQAQAADPNSFAANPPPPDATPAPKPEEWQDAPTVRLDHDVESCRAYRVREWIKINCTGMPAAGASLLAGTSTGVALWVDPPKDDGETMKTPRTVEVIFPVRRGDGRLLQVGQFGEGYDGPVSWNVGVEISEQWIEGESAPIVSVR